MRATLVYGDGLFEKATRLTKDPEELSLIIMDTALRFLLEHPADAIRVGSGEPLLGADTTSLGMAKTPVDWTAFMPTGGLAGWRKVWSPADAGLHGILASQCQQLVDQGLELEKAAQLLRKWRSLQAMIDNLDRILPKKLRPLIVEAWDNPKVAAPEIVEYSHDANGTACPHCGLLGQEATDCLNALPPFPLQDLYLQEIIKRCSDSATTGYHAIQTVEDLWEMVDALSTAPWIAVDTETTGLDPWWLDACGISLSAEPGVAYYIPIGHETSEPQLNARYVGAVLRELFSDMPLVFHNASFDLRVLEKICGVPWRWFKVKSDTQIKAFVTGLGTGDEWGTLGLKALTWILLGIRMTNIEELIGKGKDAIPFSYVPISRATPYAAADADMTGRLEPLLDRLLDEKGVRGVFDLEMQYLPIIVQMEENGVAVDLQVVGDIDKVLTTNIDELELVLQELAGHPFKLNSPEEMSTVLFEELKLPPGKKVQTGYSTEQTHLKTIIDLHPIVQQVIDYRESTKLKSTYVENLQDFIHPITGRLHVRWNQCGTASGRLSSSGGETSKLNLQNQPVRTELGAAIRSAFIAEGDNLLVGGDFSQFELRITAHITEDANMIADFHSGEDFHRRTACRMFNTRLEDVMPAERGIAKNFNFGVNYGLSPAGGVRFGLSKERTAELIDIYYTAYPRIKEWQLETIRQVHSLGYAETLFGRRRWFPEIDDESYKIRGEAERAAINHPIQGSVGDIVKKAMIGMDDVIASLDWYHFVRVLMQVHDEVIYEAAPEVAEELRWRMTEVFSNIVTLRVPVIFEAVIGHSWKELKPA